MPWTTTDEFIVIPKTQRMSLASFPGQIIFLREDEAINYSCLKLAKRSEIMDDVKTSFVKVGKFVT